MESRAHYGSSLMSSDQRPTNECFNSKDEYFICLENDGQLFTRNNQNCSNQFENWMKNCNKVNRKNFLMQRFVTNEYKFIKGRFITNKKN